MKHIRSFSAVAVIVFLFALLFPANVLAAGQGLVIVGNTLTVAAGETLEEALTVLGGQVVVDQGGAVEGNILLLGGTLRIAGRVEGNISAAGGVLELGETAEVDGDISTAGATIWQADGAVVTGEIISEISNSMRNLRADNLHMPFVLDQVLSPLAFLTRALVAAALAVMVMMFLPQPVARVAQAIVSQPVLSGGMGLLTILVFPLAFLVTVLTLLLIPAGLLALVVLALAYLFGWIALGYEVGRRIIAMFHWDWAPPVIAGVGTLAISLLAGALGQIPCLGWLISFVGWQVGLGAVILTRAGTQVYGLVSDSLNPNA